MINNIADLAKTSKFITYELRRIADALENNPDSCIVSSICHDDSGGSYHDGEFRIITDFDRDKKEGKHSITFTELTIKSIRRLSLDNN